MADPMRQGFCELHHHAAALGMPDNRQWGRTKVVEDRDGVADVGFPRVQRRALAVAVPSLIPGDDAPSSVDQSWSYEVPRCREIHASVAGQDSRAMWVSPFVYG